MAGTSDDPATGGPAGRTGVLTRRARRTATARPRRPDESMTLLREVMERPLDPGYATAAARRATGRPRSRRRSTTAGIVVVTLVLGLLVTWSVVVLRRPGPAAVEDRAQLIATITEQTDLNDALRDRIDRYRREVQAVQEEALNRRDSAAADTARVLGIAAGDVTVTGPGIVVTLDDAPGSRDQGGANSDPRADVDAENGRVFDRDLQTVVNGLWLAGAEAVSVNDQRITTRSAIRSAGEAILVDFRPLVPPYVVEAIGDPEQLETRFAAGGAGAYVQSLEDNFGIGVAVDREASLQVEAAGTLGVRLARPLEAVDAASTDDGSPPSPSASAASAAPLPSASTTPRPSSPEAAP